MIGRFYSESFRSASENPWRVSVVFRPIWTSGSTKANSTVQNPVRERFASKREPVCDLTEVRFGYRQAADALGNTRRVERPFLTRSGLASWMA